MSTLPQAVLDAAAISAITQLLLTERASRDAGDWDRMHDCFHPDSHVRLSWFSGSGPDFVKGSIDMAKRGVLAKHRLGPVLVRLAGDRALATFSGIIDIPATIGGVEAMLSSHARFLYRTERRADRWRIFSFDAVYLRDELTAALPGQSLSVTAESVARFRKSYRMLSLVLTSQGYAVSGDLPGDDRPETVATIMGEIEAWLATRSKRDLPA
jgi:hypothetical protein